MRALSLKIQITVWTVLLVAGLVAAFSYTMATSEQEMILAEILQRVILRGRNIALSSSTALLLKEDPEVELYPLISSVLKAEEHIISIVVVDRDGRIKGHKELMQFEKDYVPTAGLKTMKGFDFLAGGEELRENDEILEVSVPVSIEGTVIGFVYLQYSKYELHEAVAGINNRMIKIGLIAMTIGTIISLLLAVHITKPVSLLTKGAEAIGRGHFDTKIDVRSVREIQTLANTFNEMARRLAESREAMAEKERVDKELEIAHDIQTTLLPSNLPHYVNFEIDAYYHPASQVGGDYFDLIPIDENRLMVVVGDVAGKGIPGLVVMTMVRILARGLAMRGERPLNLLKHLNELLLKDMKKNLFVTLFCGLLDSKAGTLEFASAAHMPLLLYHSSEKVVSMLGTKAKPLGLFSDELFAQGLEEKKIKLLPGDLMLQYTDGLTEMRDAAEEEFGIKKVMEIMMDEGVGGARHLLVELKKELDRFRGGEPQSDDLTLLAISALPAGMRRVSEERMESLDKVVFE